ncbi:MAG: hypothetical protein KGJ69_11875 [Thermoplasmata archaeon]|nr:hypothetical protein [Thermoplasmata archaeon]
MSGPWPVQHLHFGHIISTIGPMAPTASVLPSNGTARKAQCPPRSRRPPVRS